MKEKRLDGCRHTSREHVLCGPLVAVTEIVTTEIVTVAMVTAMVMVIISNPEEMECATTPQVEISLAECKKQQVSCLLKDFFCAIADLNLCDKFVVFRCQGRNVLQFQQMVMRDPSAGRTISASCRTYLVETSVTALMIRIILTLMNAFFCLLFFVKPISLRTLLGECIPTICATLPKSMRIACAAQREPVVATLV